MNTVKLVDVYGFMHVTDFCFGKRKHSRFIKAEKFESILICKTCNNCQINVLNTGLLKNSWV